MISQIKNNNIGHAYLFCGTRGVGKTSIAKIFAKAINCTENTTGSPCLKCNNCIENSKSASVDILEIDAASNNGVDNIRDLKQKIQFPPINGRYKIYIIDEVHMLSIGAFNALLKTLEEPPKHAVFILATTESYKVPATILSRCTRFDFKLVPLNDLEKLVTKIFKEEKIQATPEVITAMCKAGEGSVRDTLSICDMMASFADNNITYDKFLECMGTLNTSFIYKICYAIKQKDVATILLSVKELCESGKNISILIKDMMEFFRNILVVKTIKNYKSFLNLPEDHIILLETIANMCTEGEILIYLQKLSYIDSNLKYSINQRLLCESSFIDMALYSPLPEQNLSNIDIDNIIEKKLQEKINSGIIMRPTITNKLSIFDRQENSVENNALDTNITEKKISKIDNNIEELEQKIQQPQENKVNLVDDVVITEDNNKVTRLDRIKGLFIGKVREQKTLIFLSYALNECQYELIKDVNGNDKLIFLCQNSIAFDTLKESNDAICDILKSIDENLTFEITMDTKKLKSEKTIDSLKNKFGNNLIIK